MNDTSNLRSTHLNKINQTEKLSQSWRLASHHSPLPPIGGEVDLYKKLQFITLGLKHAVEEHSFSPSVLGLISEELCLFYICQNTMRIGNSILTAFVAEINGHGLLLSPWLTAEICCQLKLAQHQDLTHSKNT